MYRIISGAACFDRHGHKEVHEERKSKEG
uniref:Uncharacterized protein n=1 Tax=Anguilla anguilla TaxID=7936 RepID=A0A0E9R626_ANGAN